MWAAGSAGGARCRRGLPGLCALAWRMQKHPFPTTTPCAPVGGAAPHTRAPTGLRLDGGGVQRREAAHGRVDVKVGHVRQQLQLVQLPARCGDAQHPRRCGGGTSRGASGSGGAGPQLCCCQQTNPTCRTGCCCCCCVACTSAVRARAAPAPALRTDSVHLAAPRSPPAVGHIAQVQRHHAYRRGQ